MYTTHLRKVGGSVMMTVPPAVLDLLHLQAGSEVGISIEGERLIIAARPRPRYALEELLAEYKASPDSHSGNREWLDDKPAGDELL